MTIADLRKSPAKNPYAPPRAYVPGARKLKVLLISHTCQSRTEGQPKAHALAALSDVELHLLTPARWMHYGKWRDAQTPVDGGGGGAKFRFTAAPVRLPWVGRAQYFLHTYPSLGKILREFRPDIIDLWEEPWGRVSAQACKLRNRILPSAKIVSETEQNIFKNLPWPFEGYRSFTLKQADYVVGRNSESIEHLRKKGYAGPAEVVPNAVDVGLFRPMDRGTCREKLFREIGGTMNGEIFLAGYVGRLVQEKGLMDMVEAVEHCPANVHVLFLGEGPLEGDLRARAAALGEHVKARVHFLPARPLEELPEVMNALDVFVLPSLTTGRWKEQFGRVLIEAAACETPCIGTNSGAIPDVIGDSGLVVGEHDPRELAEAIMALHNDRALARQMGRAGHKNALAYFTWQRVAERMSSIYQAVTASKAITTGGH